MWEKVLYQVQPLDLGLSSLQNPDPNQPLLSLIYLEYDLLSSPQKTDKITGTSVQTVRMGTEMRVPEPVFALSFPEFEAVHITPLSLCFHCSTNKWSSAQLKISTIYYPTQLHRPRSKCQLSKMFPVPGMIGAAAMVSASLEDFSYVAGSRSLKPSLRRLLLLMELLHILPPSQSFYSLGGLYSIISFTF